MIDQYARLQFEDQIKRKFRGHKIHYGKYGPTVPPSADREYVRLVNAYMGQFKAMLNRELPKLTKKYTATRREEEHLRQDSADDFDRYITEAFNRFDEETRKIMEGFGLEKKLRKIASISANLSVADWKKLVHKSLGIDIREDYYYGDFFKAVLDQWVSDNVDLIVTIPHDTLGKMKDICYKDWSTGKLTKDIANDILRQYDIDKWHALFIARDQMAKLNSNITQQEQKDAGVEEYIWDTSGDQRVRPSHARLDGTKHRWDDPPETDGGRHCNPGEDFQCRCVAIPVFDYEKLNFSGGLGTAIAGQDNDEGNN